MPLRSEFVAAECGDQHATSVRSPSFMNESRLDKLRDDAWQRGAVTGRGVDVAGGPIPRKPGYYGQPVVRPPVWTWEIPIYFFVGGLGGMSAVIALGALLFHHLDVARTAMWVAAIASVLSPILLILDLGRPHLFINMLRVFKPQSAMSMGAWILTAFGMCVVPGLIALELQTFHLFAGAIDQILGVVAGILIFGSAIFGMLLATYTGVLIGATAIPAWFLHHRLLPIHFGTAGLGSAAALLELLGHRIAPLNAIGLFAAAVESVLLIWLCVDKHGRRRSCDSRTWFRLADSDRRNLYRTDRRLFCDCSALSRWRRFHFCLAPWSAGSVGLLSEKFPAAIPKPFLPRRRCSTGIFAVGQAGVPPATAIRQARRPSAPQPRWLCYAKITRSICV